MLKHKIPIAIAEDQPKLLKTLVDALLNFDEIEIVFTAQDGEEAVKKFTEATLKPQVILMDIEMPIMNGIEATRRISALDNTTKILMLTVFDDEQAIFEAITAGACGYLLKGERLARIVQSVLDAVEGRLPMSPTIASKALKLMQQVPQSEKSPQDFGLTKREVEILEYLSNAWTYKQIAEKLFISNSTVRNHIHSIYQKIHVSSKTEAVQLAMKNLWFS